MDSVWSVIGLCLLLSYCSNMTTINKAVEVQAKKYAQETECEAKND